MTGASILLAMMLAGPGATDRCAPILAPTAIVCQDAGLRQLDGELAGLVDRVRRETAGVDGETGRSIDPVAAEQRRWRQATMARCHDAACLNAAYRSRIDAVRTRWAEALR